MYENIYNIYDNLNKNKKYETETTFILKKCNQINGILPKNILDIGCGTGSHLKYFSTFVEFGLGIDISEKMIAEAISKNLSNIEFKACTIENITDYTKFDIITLLFQVVNHISSIDDLEKIFYHISNKSNERTLVIFDIFNIVAMILDNPKKENRQIENMNIIIDPEFDALNSKLILNYTIKSKNKTTKYILNETLWNIHTIKNILTKYGFNTIEILNNWTEEKATINSYKILFICQKI
jgi:SAM-dependent methyltransferase